MVHLMVDCAFVSESVTSQNAGIFVDDILDAVPIDKYFELFKPGTGSEGGFIRVAMNYDTHLPENGQGARRPLFCLLVCPLACLPECMALIPPMAARKGTMRGQSSCGFLCCAVACLSSIARPSTVAPFRQLRPSSPLVRVFMCFCCRGCSGRGAERALPAPAQFQHLQPSATARATARGRGGQAGTAGRPETTRR